MFAQTKVIFYLTVSQFYALDRLCFSGYNKNKPNLLFAEAKTELSR